MADKRTSLYLVGQRNGNCILPYCKVGIAADVKSRLSGLNTGNPFECFLYKSFIYPNREIAANIERIALMHLSGRRVRGEWVRGTPEEIFPMIRHILDDDRLARKRLH